MVTADGARITLNTLRYSFDSQFPLSIQRAAKLLAVLKWEAETIFQFLNGLRGSVHKTLEKGPSAAWLHELLKPHCTEILMSNPWENSMLENGNMNGRADARDLAEPS